MVEKLPTDLKVGTQRGMLEALDRPACIYSRILSFSEFEWSVSWELHVATIEVVTSMVELYLDPTVLVAYG